MLKLRKIIVVGGGASGLMAAGRAAECGAEVMLLEKMATPARKIRITGKGRCNLSNTADISDFITHFGTSGRFLRQVFGQFFSGELTEFLASHGMAVTVERGGRIFPSHADAPAVARVLIDWCKSVGVKILPTHPVSELIITGEMVSGVVCNKKIISADSVILATGGKSYPRTGSTGDGYKLAESAGHTLVPVSPSLVPLMADKAVVKELAGLELKNIKARLYINLKKKKEAFGELIFTHAGLSGPIILTMSSIVVEALKEHKQVAIHLDLKPALDDKKLDARLLRDRGNRGNEPMHSVLRGLLPQPLVAVCLNETEIDPEVAANQLNAEKRKKLRYWLKDFRFKITGHSSFDEAIITNGGVATREIEPRTMESKKTRGLYLVGELLDIQAETGGYNLQAAFSTGWVAGQSAAL